MIEPSAHLIYRESSIHPAAHRIMRNTRLYRVNTIMYVPDFASGSSA